LHEKAFEGPRASKPEVPFVVPEEMGGPVPGLEVQELGEIPEESDSVLDDLGMGEAGDDDAFWVADHEASEAGYLPEGDVIPQEQVGTAMPRAWSATDLAIGSWVELMLKGEWVRAQLTWASPHRTLFMFISGKGLAHSMSRRTMDRLRNRGLMRVVAESHVMDNALDGVAQTALRNDRAAR
jgi:hypothetical protein